MQITINYGVESATKTVAEGTTVGQIKKDYRPFFGWGDNLNAIVDGVVMPDATVLSDGADVVMETAANTKG